MKTFLAASHYDRRWYAVPTVVLTATVGIGTLLAMSIVLHYSLPAQGGATTALVLLSLVCDGLLIAAPILFLRYAINLGSSATPRLHRLFVHTLPVNRAELAWAKLAHGVCWIFLLPLTTTAAVIMGFALADASWASSTLIAAVKGRPDFWLGFPVLVLTCLIWTMLQAALLPMRWLVIAGPLFVVGEAWARNVVTWDALRHRLSAAASPTLASVAADSALLLGLAGTLSVLFVIHHRRHDRRCDLWFALLALLVFDAIRFSIH